MLITFKQAIELAQANLGLCRHEVVYKAAFDEAVSLMRRKQFKVDISTGIVTSVGGLEASITEYCKDEFEQDTSLVFGKFFRPILIDTYYRILDEGGDICS